MQLGRQPALSRGPPVNGQAGPGPGPGETLDNVREGKGFGLVTDLRLKRGFEIRGHFVFGWS